MWLGLPSGNRRSALDAKGGCVVRDERHTHPTAQRPPSPEVSRAEAGVEADPRGDRGPTSCGPPFAAPFMRKSLGVGSAQLDRAQAGVL
jgi:hypothetical protein